MLRRRTLRPHCRRFRQIADRAPARCRSPLPALTRAGHTAPRLASAEIDRARRRLRLSPRALARLAIERVTVHLQQQEALNRKRVSRLVASWFDSWFAADGRD